VYDGYKSAVDKVRGGVGARLALAGVARRRRPAGAASYFTQPAGLLSGVLKQAPPETPSLQVAPNTAGQVFKTLDDVFAQYCPGQKPASPSSSPSKSIVETALEKVLGSGALVGAGSGGAGASIASLVKNAAGRGGGSGQLASLGTGSYITQIMRAIQNTPAVKAMSGLLGGNRR
jgi:hypothetical protein